MKLDYDIHFTTWPTAQLWNFSIMLYVSTASGYFNTAL